jgi:hypothetical protein
MGRTWEEDKYQNSGTYLRQVRLNLFAKKGEERLKKDGTLRNHRNFSLSMIKM